MRIVVIIEVLGAISLVSYMSSTIGNQNVGCRGVIHIIPTHLNTHRTRGDHRVDTSVVVIRDVQVFGIITMSSS